MKSFGIKRDANDPRWKKFIEWLNERTINKIEGTGNWVYGIDSDGEVFNGNIEDIKIITLDEWEAEFMHQKLAYREYDERLLRDWLNFHGVVVAEENIMSNGLTKGFNDFLDQRYAKTDRISEIKAQIEKLTIELKELEG